MTRKELLGSLLSKGIVVTNPLFENEDLDRINDEVEDILELISEDEYEEDTPVAEQELIGKCEGDTEVVHVLYPGAEQYATIMDWASRMKEEYEAVDLKYFEDQDAFVFYTGEENEALTLAEEIIEGIEYN